MPNYIFKCPGCQKERECFFLMDQVKEREDGVPCLDCGTLAERVWSLPSQVFIKHTYVGDLWDKQNINPVKSGTETAKINRERVANLRSKNKSNG